MSICKAPGDMPGTCDYTGGEPAGQGKHFYPRVPIRHQGGSEV